VTERVAVSIEQDDGMVVSNLVVIDTKVLVLLQFLETRHAMHAIDHGVLSIANITHLDHRLLWWVTPVNLQATDE
jgi:hypothetical protein